MVAMDPVMPKKKPVLTPHLGAPRSIMGTENEKHTPCKMTVSHDSAHERSDDSRSRLPSQLRIQPCEPSTSALVSPPNRRSRSRLEDRRRNAEH